MQLEHSLTVKMSADQVWELICDREAQTRWLGPGSHIGNSAGSGCTLSHGDRTWAGRVAEVRERSLMIDIQVDDVEDRRIEITAQAEGQGSTRLVVAVHGAEDAVSPLDTDGRADDGSAPVDDLRHTDEPANPLDRVPWQRHWTEAFERFDALVRSIIDEKRQLRQAVIVVHGIGEQEPGTTLRSLVEGVLDPTSTGGPERDRRSWWKPDRTSQLFELRRVTLKATAQRRRPTTDVYELYWAHLIRDTTVANVTSWLRHLLLRRHIPRHLRALWALTWIGILGTVALAVARLFGWDPPFLRWLLGGGVVTAVVALVWQVAGRGIVVHSFGDAARYLVPRPGNIAHRQTIREAGVDLLDRLHRSGRYDRIVVLGHSLGSVIAYDVLTHYWIMRGREHSRLSSVSNRAAVDINKALKAYPPADPVAAQELQFKAWLDCRENGQPWLVSDFVTIGSPLSMGDFLMADGPAEFERARSERRFPTCPPQAEVEASTGHAVATYPDTYAGRTGGPSQKLEMFNHGAPFAVTRWTNLYFPSKLLRDPIGGPVAPKFGNWIRDVPLEPPKGRRFNLHSWYWRPAESDAHVAQLGHALQLRLGRQLLAAKQRHSPLMYLPTVDRPF